MRTSKHWSLAQAERQMRVPRFVLVAVLCLLPLAVSAQDGSNAPASSDGSATAEQQPLPRPRPTREPLIPAISTCAVEVQVQSAEQLAQLQAMGYACPELGVCRLEVRGDELLALRAAGYEPHSDAPTDSPEAPAPDVSALNTVWVFGSNYDDYNIPDHNGTVRGRTWSPISISSAPTNAVVTRVRYALGVSHERPSDVRLTVGHDFLPSTYETVWNRLGGSTDGGFDDDAESDNDIYLYRWIDDSVFAGHAVNGDWYLDAYDEAPGNTGFIYYWEIWIYYNTPPTTDWVSPDSGSCDPGVSMTFSTRWCDEDGPEDLKWCMFHIGTTSAQANNVLLNFNMATKKIMIRNNLGTKWWGGKLIGSDNVIQNDQAKVYCALSEAGPSGDCYKVFWQVEFKPGFAGTKNTYLKVKDVHGAKTTMVKKGTWTINSP